MIKLHSTFPAPIELLTTSCHCHQDSDRVIFEAMPGKLTASRVTNFSVYEGLSG